MAIQLYDLGPFKGALKQNRFKEEGKRRFPEVGSENILAPFLDCFAMDSEKIKLSRAARRQSSKTQTNFVCPCNRHNRTRLSHSAEVVNCAVWAASVLELNVGLCKAIAWAHDIGHAPFGHAGEAFLTQKTGHPFRHNVFGVVVAQHIERRGSGLNLCRETLLGILYHSRGSGQMRAGAPLPEHDLVMFCNKIAYTIADINDAVWRGDIARDGINQEILNLANKFGATQRERINYFLIALIKESAQEGKISFSLTQDAQDFETLHHWMHKDIYPRVDWSIHNLVMDEVYNFISAQSWFEGIHPAVVLALMTDEEMRFLAERLLRTEKLSMEDFLGFGLMEIISPLQISGKEIDFTDPDIDW